MDPQTQFCSQSHCPSKGLVGKGNIGIKSQKEQRYRCRTCGHSFAATTGTAYYRLHHEKGWMDLVLTLLSHGCPLPAIVAAFGLDERTVAEWEQKAGKHCEAVHQHLVQAGHVDAKHLQADELVVKEAGGRTWVAMAMAVASRLWLGAVLSAHRDEALIRALVEQVRACAKHLGIVVCVDGLASYVTVFLSVFRNPVRTGKPGRPRLVLAEGFQMAQVVKQYVKRHVVSVDRRVVVGKAKAIRRRIKRTHSGKDINTAFIERLNATFRSRIHRLVRRGRALAHRDATVKAAVYLVGCAYNFCWYHESLRQEAVAGGEHKWTERTPAMAAGLTDHRWSLRELLEHRVPPPLWVAPKRRGRPPKPLQQPEVRLAA